MTLFRLVVCVAAVVALSGCESGATIDSGPPPRIDSASVESVEIEIGDGQAGPRPTGRSNGATLATRDQAKVRGLIDVLNEAQPTSDHKCGDSGQVFIHLKGGALWKLGILPGHHAPYYEFRVYQGSTHGIFRVDRKAFKAAMENLGVRGLDEGFPK